MKKILLGVTGVRAEMRGGKLTQSLCRHPPARKIKLSQRTLHPDIHGKRGVKAVGKQQDTIGNFAANAAQFHQFRARFGQRQVPRPLQIESAIGNLSRRREQVRRAKSHLARAQFGFGSGSKALRHGEGINFTFLHESGRARHSVRAVVGNLCVFYCSRRRARECAPYLHRNYRFAKSFAQQRNNLPDLDDLFGRGQDERCETFPRILAQHAQSAARGDRAPHRHIVGKCFEHRPQIHFSLQVIAQPLPISDRPGSFGENAIRRSPQPHGIFPNHAGPKIGTRGRAIRIPLPTEDLAGIERRRQIIIVSGENHHV